MNITSGFTSLIGFEIQCDNQIFRNYPNVTWSEYQVRCVKNQSFIVQAYPLPSTHQPLTPLSKLG